MAKKPAFTMDDIKALGIDRLVRLVHDESLVNSSFKKLVKAALAGTKGPDAVAKLIDRRLNGLKRAKSFVDWDRLASFRDDLRTLADMICGELANLSPVMAVDRLLAFIKTHEQVYGRVDDSNGIIQDIYHDALARLETMLPGVAKDDLDFLPQKVTDILIGDEFGFFETAMRAVCPYLSPETLQHWDDVLQNLYAEWQTQQIGDSWERGYRLCCLNAGRQIIAYSRNDIDKVLQFEEEKHENSRNYIGIANYLLKNGRAKEALQWVQKKSERPSNTSDEYDYNDLMDYSIERDDDCFVDEEYLDILPSMRPAHVEAKILTALGDKKAAQQRRWRCFENLLSPIMLREYIDNLDDFEEFEATDRAFSYIMDSENIYRALNFFLEWPKLDFAARLVVKHYQKWDGANYFILPNAAKVLQHEYALAATLLYRCLIDNILERQRTKGYRHAANYCTILQNLAKEADDEGTSHSFYMTHQQYIASLQNKHGRKASFWNLHDVR